MLRILGRPLGLSIGVLLVMVASPLGHAADQPPTFKADVQLVAVNVIVTNQQGQVVTNLDADAFHLSEDDRPQHITQFTKDPLPLSIAVALDTSASMRRDRFRYARDAIWRLVDRVEPQDQIAIYGFNNRPYPITSWTSSRNGVVMALSDEQPMAAGGYTALYDAAEVALKLLETATTRRRALLVISDGIDEMPGDVWSGGAAGRAGLKRFARSISRRLHAGRPGRWQIPQADGDRNRL